MLQRKMLDHLRIWRRSKRNEALLVKGARQVGKSFVVDQFGKNDYDSFISIDFIKQPQLKAAFEGSLDPAEILLQISLLMPKARLVPGSTLLFLDEIQECPKARSALKYLAQDARFDTVASGSLLGIRYHDGREQPSIPVGYERAVEMHPLGFDEFLWARGYSQEAVASLSRYLESFEAVPDAVNDAMMRLFREYIAIGGMPSVVQSFIDSNSFGVVHDEQVKLLESYVDDIAKYATASERVKARACYESLPRQLSKGNTKFQYAVVEKRGTARKFDGSVDWLVGANMVLKSQAVSLLSYPLASYEDSSRFRLYANDTGLLMAMHDFDMKAAVVNNTLAGPMKGGLYENAVACMLAQNGVALRYWTSKDSKREVEFAGQQDAAVVPVEVKASRGTSLSFDEVLARDDVKLGYKLIDDNVGRFGKKVTLPLYLGMFLFQRRPE